MKILSNLKNNIKKSWELSKMHTVVCVLSCITTIFCLIARGWVDAFAWMVIFYMAISEIVEKDMRKEIEVLKEEIGNLKK